VEPARTALLQAFTPQQFAKGQPLLRAGQPCHHYHFIERGLIKSSFFREDKEFIMTFFKENILCTEITSYLRQAPARYPRRASTVRPSAPSA
jgi:CRP-like cAMP-binding protein